MSEEKKDFGGENRRPRNDKGFRPKGKGNYKGSGYKGRSGDSRKRSSNDSNDERKRGYGKSGDDRKRSFARSDERRGSDSHRNSSDKGRYGSKYGEDHRRDDSRRPTGERTSRPPRDKDSFAKGARGGSKSGGYRGKPHGDKRGKFGDDKRRKPSTRPRFDDTKAKAIESPEQTEATQQEAAEAPKRSWTPNKERTIKSKREYDRERMSKLVDEEKPIYSGELDPRKKREEEEKQREERAAQKEKLAKLDYDPSARYARTDESSDFRDLFEKCDASPARLGALYVTRNVRRRKAYAQHLIETTIDNSHMSAADRSFATLLILGVVSTWGTLDDCIDRCIRTPRDITPEVRDALRISTYEIIMLGKAPHAAVDQGVELVRAIAPSASRLANAVLHRILEMKDKFPFGDPKTDIEALARFYAFPTWLAKMLIADMGAADAAMLMKTANDPAPLFIAVNALKADDGEVLQAFEEAGCVLEPFELEGKVLPGCYRVSKSRVLADGRIRLLFAQGKVLVSDASAQFVASSLFEGFEPKRVLEVGAGRGTKTILIQSDAQRILGHQVALSSIDNHAFKMELLEQRAKEYGVQLERVYTGNALRLDAVMQDEMFDTVFIDAPCSGLGTLRRHQEIRWRVNKEQIEELAKTGLGMLKSAASHVSEGGQIVYATCTVTYRENFGVVKEFLESPEGSMFALAPIEGKSCFFAKPGIDAPDAHFAVRFVKKSETIAHEDENCE